MSRHKYRYTNSVHTDTVDSRQINLLSVFNLDSEKKKKKAAEKQNKATTKAVDYSNLIIVSLWFKQLGSFFKRKLDCLQGRVSIPTQVSLRASEFSTNIVWVEERYNVPTVDFLGVSLSNIRTFSTWKTTYNHFYKYYQPCDAHYMFSIEKEYPTPPKHIMAQKVI